ncbi:MAG: hypothetical protein K0S70_579 [Microbacterium sp.]|jgi:hypothetical protein|nr:hypothetical protein [Microbacterium sp.]
MTTVPTPDEPFPGYPPSDPRPLTPGGRAADVTASVILILAGIVGFGFLGFMSMFLGMASDGCFGQCNSGLISLGWMIALFGTPAVFLASIVWTMVRLSGRRVAWWVPLAGAMAALMVWFVGVEVLRAGLAR